MTIDDKTGDGDEKARDELKKIKLVEDTQLSLFIIVHVYGEPNGLDPFEGLRRSIPGGLKLSLPIGDHAGGLYASMKEREPMR